MVYAYVLVLMLAPFAGAYAGIWCWTRIRDRRLRDMVVDVAGCPVREDETHCECWWDGTDPCCSCGQGQEMLEPDTDHVFDVDYLTR